ncbi:hypothetical protein FCG67_18330 [Rhodococcus oryzae]|uniref:Uncharacterized protein n=1 Tax=Rhodococcus oryzae TaxID=2571143 RepID=A0ABY2RGC6_9NOCA|nr:hypothetical protein [Rhodococcus oryzae]TJZ75980.1 hypothetical protein FCG67_18330 [Rhodococcus oryzae]
MKRPPPEFDGFAQLDSAEPTLVAAHLFVRVFGAKHTYAAGARLKWHPIITELARLGGCDSEFRLFSGGERSDAIGAIATECVLRWESALLAARRNEDVLLLRAGVTALASPDPVRTVWQRVTTS